MKNNTQIFPWFMLHIGFIAYMIAVLNNTPAHAEMYGGSILMITLALWVILNITMNSFNVKDFIKVFCISLYIFAITVFLLHGIEEISYPEGAIIFHPEQIFKALGLIFIGSLPLLYFYIPSNPTYTNLQTVQNTVENDNEEPDNQWEPATQIDLDAGDWEIDS